MDKIANIEQQNVESTTYPELPVRTFNVKALGLILLLLIFSFFTLFWFILSKYSFFHKPSFEADSIGEPVPMKPPLEGWTAEQKNNMNMLLGEISYYQPSYLPLGFKKISDLNNNDFAILSFFSNPTSTSSYDSLTINLYPLDKAKIYDLHLYPLSTTENVDYFPVSKMKERAEKMTRRVNGKPIVIKEFTVQGVPAVYFESPASPLDPYFSAGFPGSEDEKKMQTENEKNVYLVLDKTVIHIHLDFGYEISSEQAFRELSKVAESLGKAKISEDLKITDIDQQKIDLEYMRFTASGIAQALRVYKSKNGGYPWEKISSCNNGKLPESILVSSAEFAPCLAAVEELIYRKDDPHYYNKNLLKNLYITGYGYSSFTQQSFLDENVEITSGGDIQAPRICYKAEVLSDYVASYLVSSPRQFVDDYPMFRQNGNVDLSCKDDPIGKNCYNCTH